MDEYITAFEALDLLFEKKLLKFRNMNIFTVDTTFVSRKNYFVKQYHMIISV